MAIPAPGPVLVRPGEAEREIDGRVVEEAVDWPLQQPLAIEPVVVERERVDASGAGEIDLSCQSLRPPEVVEAEVARHPWLVVLGETGIAPCDVGPLCEPFAPPLIVLGDRV